MRERITTCCEIVGLALICLATFRFNEILGMAAAGFVLLIVGVATGRK